MQIPPSDNRQSSPGVFGAFSALPGGIWALGLVSLFMDISSELIHSLLPVFMSAVLGVSMTTIGFVEGVAEATAAVTKIFSGAISDYLGKRKFVAGIGYGLAAVTKPIFPLATTIGWVFAGRFLDRIGKGIRGAPRDALVADIAPRELRGAAYGLRQSLDSVGAFVGPLIALVFMVWFANDIRAVLWVAVFPAFIAVTLLVFYVHDPEPAAERTNKRNPLKFSEARLLPPRYWLIVLLGGVFTMARFSEAFLVLRAQDVGLGMGYVPLVLVAMNVCYTMTAFPAGVAADQFSRRTLLMAGLVMLIAADLIIGSRRIAVSCPHRRSTLGNTHGDHPGAVRQACGGRFSRCVTRYGFRYLQPGQRGYAFAIEFYCGCAMERFRCAGHFFDRSGLCHDSGARTVCLPKEPCLRLENKVIHSPERILATLNDSAFNQKQRLNPLVSGSRTLSYFNLYRISETNLAKAFHSFSDKLDEIRK